LNSSRHSIQGCMRALICDILFVIATVVTLLSFSDCCRCYATQLNQACSIERLCLRRVQEAAKGGRRKVAGSLFKFIVKTENSESSVQKDDPVCKSSDDEEGDLPAEVENPKEDGKEI